ncbi:MAG: gamma-glutamyltransferase [Pseudomonadota bacterium]|jgi:gamma-glutamyltranspeptidase/glutathione hydrolase
MSGWRWVRLRVAAVVWAVWSAAALAAPVPKNAVASAHPWATAAGMDMLRAGGNAFDAAVAISAVLAVVEPASSGVGGGGFYLLHTAKGGRDVMVDARETAPLAARPDLYVAPDRAPGASSTDGPLAAGIPGEPAAWAHLAKQYGRLPLRQSLAPAIRIAHEGFPLYARLQNAIRVKQARLAASSEAGRVFLEHGQVPEVGALIRQPELASTLEMLARDGVQAFYQGAFADRLVAAVRRDGGIWTREDLARYRVVERVPLTLHYRDATLVTAAPPSSGGVVIGDVLNMLSGYDLARLDRDTRRHLTIEALRRAFRDRAEYLGDPDFVKMPLARLLSADYAAGQATSIRLDRATPSEMLRPVTAETEGQHTTHFSVLDAAGNRVAATISINLFFGATYMVPGTGFLLNDTMDDFSTAPGQPNAFQLVGAAANAVGPGKRPLSSMTPTFVETPRGLLIIGSPGGSTIISNVLFGILGWFDGLSAAEIVALPRFHHQYLPDVVTLEPGALSAAERAALERLGHHLSEGRYGWGNTQVITWDYGTGKVETASDPRGFGAGLVY